MVFIECLIKKGLSGSEDLLPIRFNAIFRGLVKTLKDLENDWRIRNLAERPQFISETKIKILSTLSDLMSQTTDNNFPEGILGWLNSSSNPEERKKKFLDLIGDAGSLEEGRGVLHTACFDLMWDMTTQVNERGRSGP